MLIVTLLYKMAGELTTKLGAFTEAGPPFKLYVCVPHEATRPSLLQYVCATAGNVGIDDDTIRELVPGNAPASDRAIPGSVG